MFFSKYIKKNKFLYSIVTNAISFTLLVLNKLRRVNIEGSDNIVVIAIYKLGDTVFSLQAVKNISEYHKNKNIVLICFPESRTIYDLIFKLNYIDLHNDDLYYLRVVKPNIKNLLKALKPEIIYDITGDIRSASLILFSNAPVIVGSNELYFRHLYTHFKEQNSRMHLTDHYSNSLSLYIPDIKSFTFQLSNVPEGNYIAIHPNAGWKAKEWNFNKFIQLGKALHEKFNILFILPAGKKNYQTQLESEKLPFIISSDFQELIYTIKNSILLIGNDSGPVHIASLFNVPTFTIYGPTNPRFHLPKSGNNKYINTKVKCSPVEDKWCHKTGGILGCSSFICMNQLDYDTVFNCASEFIAELNIPVEKGHI